VTSGNTIDGFTVGFPRTPSTASKTIPLYEVRKADGEIMIQKLEKN
jgi:hypothetical protein